jgi:amidase
MPVISWDEYLTLDGLALAELLSRGEISAQELAQQTSEAAALMNPELRAIVEVFDDSLQPAPEDFSDTAYQGVPLFMKDMGSRMIGRAQACGYTWLQDNVADADDPLTQNYRAAGFNLIGRSSCPEDGITIVTSSRDGGDCRNPWQLNHTPGGSSGGASSLVAAGISPLATSSDGGGSTRFPAGWTGLVGLKTTRGRLPLPHGANEATYACAAEGVVTRTVRDSAMLAELLSKRPCGSGFMPYPDDAVPLREAVSAQHHRQLRIALSTGNWSRGVANDAEITAAVEKTAKQLEALGHTVVPVSDNDICDFSALFEGYLMANWVAPIGIGLQAVADAHGITLSPDNTSCQALNHIESAKRATLNDYLAAQAQGPISCQEWGNFWSSGFDALLCPMTPILCPTLDNPYRSDADLPFDHWLNGLVDAARYTMPANETGLPAIALPAGLDSNGCPLSVQLYGPWHSEFNLLALAAQLEAAAPDNFGNVAPYNIAAVASCKV